VLHAEELQERIQADPAIEVDRFDPVPSVHLLLHEGVEHRVAPPEAGETFLLLAIERGPVEGGRHHRAALVEEEDERPMEFRF